MSEKKGFLAMFKLGAILALYAAAACVGLAFVYAGTVDKIAENRQKDLDNALKELFPDADAFNPIHNLVSPDPAVIFFGDIDDPANTGVFEVIKDNSIIGVALRTSRISFSGTLKILVGVGIDGTIKGIKILENIDTPGLGSNASRPQFYTQFTGKSVTDPFVPKQDIAAITAATITTTAASDSVKAAGIAAMEWLSSRGIR